MKYYFISYTLFTGEYDFSNDCINIHPFLWQKKKPKCYTLLFYRETSKEEFDKYNERSSGMGYELQILTWEDENKVIATHDDPVLLAKSFCEENVIPIALQCGAGTKKKVEKLLKEENWSRMLQVYMDCPADMFATPQMLKIHNSQTGDVFFEVDLR